MFSDKGRLWKHCDNRPKNGPVPRRPVNGYHADSFLPGSKIIVHTEDAAGCRVYYWRERRRRGDGGVVVNPANAG